MCILLLSISIAGNLFSIYYILNCGAIDFCTIFFSGKIMKKKASQWLFMGDKQEIP